MVGGVGHTGGLTNPRPWRGRCRASCSNTGVPPLPRKRVPYQKNLLPKSQPKTLGIGHILYPDCLACDKGNKLIAAFALGELELCRGNTASDLLYSHVAVIVRTQEQISTA